MNEQTVSKIQEIATQLASQLGVASSVVYQKLIWYVRVDGVTNFIGNALVWGAWFMLGVFLYKKAKTYKDNKEDLDGGVFILSAVGLLLYLLSWYVIYNFVATFVNNGMRIFVPEYWIIKAVLNKAGIIL